MKILEKHSHVVDARRKTYLFLFAGLLLMLSNQATADLILRFDSGTVESGGVGYIDLFVESNGTDTFTVFNYRVEISAVSVVNGGILEFQESFNSLEPRRQLSTEQGQLNYIFAGQSKIDNFTAIRQDPDRLQLVGGDAEENLSSITVSAGQSYLLARLELQHITPTPGVSTGSFRVSLLEDPAFTYFQNIEIDDLDPGQPKIDSSSYSVLQSGIVTITAVPEPSSILLVSCFLGLTVFWRRQRGSV